MTAVTTTNQIAQTFDKIGDRHPTTMLAAVKPLGKLAASMWIATVLALGQSAAAQPPSNDAPPKDSSKVIDWSAGKFDAIQRTNPFGLGSDEFAKACDEGSQIADLNPSPHTLMIPIDILLREHKLTPEEVAMLAAKIAGVHHQKDGDEFLGLRSEQRKIFEENAGNKIRALRVSCYACHSNNLFGRQVLGATNKVVRLSNFQTVGKRLASQDVHQNTDDLTSHELFLVNKFRSDIQASPVSPQHKPGLSNFAPLLSRDEILQSFRSASAQVKPIPWWQSRYKSRWLVDGFSSNVNPVLTLLLSFENGLGSDVYKTSDWLIKNPDVLTSITTAVFSAEPPRYEDYFKFSSVELNSARSGSVLFSDNCSSCHGEYPRTWRTEESLVTGFDRERVYYPQPTVGYDVGTDRRRLLAAAAAEKDQLEGIEILERSQVKFESLGEYVPPPLVGVWASWPYLHNGSVPTLRDLFEASANRPKQFYIGPSLSEQTDFDREKNGFPIPAPLSWRSKDFLYDTSQPGQSNRGHDVGIFVDESGQPVFTDKEKTDLLNFLKTL